MQVLIRLLFLSFVGLLYVNSHIWQKVEVLNTLIFFHTTLLALQSYDVTQNPILS